MLYGQGWAVDFWGLSRDPVFTTRSELHLQHKASHCKKALEDDDWWRSIFVMLSGARKLENMALLGYFPGRRWGPPVSLI